MLKGGDALSPNCSPSTQHYSPVLHISRNLLYPFSRSGFSSLSLLALSHWHLNRLNFFLMRISLDPMDPSGHLLEKSKSLLTISLSFPHCLSFCSPCNLAYTMAHRTLTCQGCQGFFMEIVVFRSFQTLTLRTLPS